MAGRQVRQEAGHRPGQHRRPERRPRLRRDRRAGGGGQALRGGRGHARSGRLPHRDRRPGAGLGPGGGRQAGRPDHRAGLLPDHAGLAAAAPAFADEGIRRHHLPGRGRDRRHLLRPGRVLRRRAGRDLVVRARHRAQDRGHGPGHLHRAAADHRQFPARRPVHRPADQDRAVGPVSGHLRPQRRRAAARHRCRLARRLLRRGHRIGAPGGQIHDPGDAADRRLHRQRRRAVAPARRGQAAADRRQPHHRAARRGRLQPVRARPADAVAPLGQAGHAGAGAPHRRPGEVVRHRPHLLRRRQPPEDDRGAPRQGGRHRRRHPAPDGQPGRQRRRPGGGRLGLHLRPHRAGGAARAGGGA